MTESPSLFGSIPYRPPVLVTIHPSETLLVMAYLFFFFFLETFRRSIRLGLSYVLPVVTSV